MVSEHNVGQPVEAIGVMDRVEVVSILQKVHPWQAYQVVDRPFRFVSIYKCIYVNTEVNVSNYTFNCFVGSMYSNAC